MNFGQEVLWDYDVIVEDDPILWMPDTSANAEFGQDVDWDHSVGAQDIENITWE